MNNFDPDKTTIQKVDPEATVIHRTDSKVTSMQKVDPDATVIYRGDPDATLFRANFLPRKRRTTLLSGVEATEQIVSPEVANLIEHRANTVRLGTQALEDYMAQEQVSAQASVQVQPQVQPTPAPQAPATEAAKPKKQQAAVKETFWQR